MLLPAPPECLVQVALKESLPEIPVNNKGLLMFHNYFPKYLIASPVPNNKKLLDIKYTITVEISALPACAKTKTQMHICRPGEDSVCHQDE